MQVVDIDTDVCIAGQCEMLAPDTFEVGDDGITDAMAAPKATASTPQEWLEHLGSVGQGPARGSAHCHRRGQRAARRQGGQCVLLRRPEFEYHNDPEKTATAHNSRGWPTRDDVGYLDDDGFLYLTDRKAYTIIAGGVNVYSQEAENILTMHPAVMDVAVFGVSNDLSEDRYFDVAVDLLGERGPEGLTIAALCRHLGVTKDSFYHHFHSMPDFATRLLQWFTAHNDLFVKMFARERDVARRVELTIETASRLDHAAKAALRAWARSNDEVAAAATAVDDRRDGWAVHVFVMADAFARLKHFVLATRTVGGPI